MAAQSFGKYQLVKKLATGGMAEVWLAKQTGIEGFNRHIVVKRILSHLAEDPEFVAMFLQEARIASRFNHPNIAQIYDLGEEDGAYFIAMEFIHGEDLGRIMRRAWATQQWVARPLAIRIIADAAAGLHYAHARLDDQGRPLRIVHRDISPQNILVSFDGSVKLVDFGIAKAADQASHTKSGAIKGKFAYMAPEQAAGKVLDARTDLFALGLVLYELITGVRPLKRDSEIATLQAALEGSIEKPSLVAEVPAELDDVVMRALAKDPDQRYRDGRQLQMALEQYLVQEGTVATSVQVSELMETLFADRLKEEARLGVPAPASESSVSNPVAEPAKLEPQPRTQMAEAPHGPSSTRDDDEVLDRDTDDQPTLMPDDDEGPRVGDFKMPSGTVVPSRPYATSIARRPTSEVEPASSAPRRPKPPARSDVTADELPEVERRDEPRRTPIRPKRATSTGTSMPEAPPRRSKSIPAAKEPRKSKSFEKGEVSKLVDVKEIRQRQSGRLKVLVAVVLLAAVLVLGVLFREPLYFLLTNRRIDVGTPILLTVISRPRVRVQVIPPADVPGRQRVELGESPLDRVSGAFVNDTILLVNEERGIRYEETFAFAEPNETKTINKTFEEGTINVAESPQLKGATVWRAGQKLGQTRMNIKLMEGQHELEVRADSLDRPFPFEVTLKPREHKKIPVDLSTVSEQGAKPQ